MGQNNDKKPNWDTTAGPSQILKDDVRAEGNSGIEVAGIPVTSTENWYDGSYFLTGDDTGRYIGAKQWDVRDIACAVSGVLVDDFVSFEYNNAREITHIMSIREAVGYNLGASKPTFGIHMRSTSSTITSLMKIKEEDRLVDVVLTAPSIMVTCFAGILGNIPLGPIGPEAPEIVASGLALRIAEYAERNHWIIQSGTLMANQNHLYNAKGGLTNSLDARTDFPWHYKGLNNLDIPDGGIRGHKVNMTTNSSSIWEKTY